MNIYFIPGLGADKRIFKNIKIPTGCTAHYLDWIKPHHNESLQSYAYRLSDTMDTSKPFVIVGLSFGGMLAAEIVNKFPNGSMLLLSSVTSSRHLPGYYQIAGRLGIHKLIPVSLLKSVSLMKRLFTAESSEQKAYLRKVIREVDTSFIRWGLDAIVKWRGSAATSNFVHVHGSKDAILPVRYCKPTHVITGGGHLMILTREKEISDILKKFIEHHQQHT